MRRLEDKGKQVRLAMVPYDSQHLLQLSEQITWNSDEQLLNECPLFGCKMTIFDKNGSKIDKKIWKQIFKFIYSLKTINSVHIR